MTKSTREISNLFIYSGFKYYLRQETDSYILFSPVKYFKSCNLVDKTFKDGFIFNRKHFHASPSSISCILWQNTTKEQEEFSLKAYDIILNKEIKDIQEQTNKGKLEYIKDITIKKCRNNFLSFYDKRKDTNDLETNVWCGTNGYERDKINRKSQKSFYNKNIIAYLRSINFAIAPLNNYLVRQQFYIDDGFYLRSDNFIEKLPLFCAKLYPQENWYERDIYFTTADKGLEYLKDKELLKSSLIFACLTNKNKCRSFLGSDGRFYKNELCFDRDTLANEYLRKYKINDFEKELLRIWDNILQEIENKKEYNSKINYGLYQINEEININYKDAKNNTIYKYPELNSLIRFLKQKLKEYYKESLERRLFELELVK